MGNAPLQRCLAGSPDKSSLGSGISLVRRIALVAHDGRKDDMCEWAVKHRQRLLPHVLYATGATGAFVRDAAGLEVNCLSSGPLGGDQQIGARIVEGSIDMLILFWDPMAVHPHADDVRALLRIAVLRDVPLACNRSTADSIIRSVSVPVPADRDGPVVPGQRQAGEPCS